MALSSLAPSDLIPVHDEIRETPEHVPDRVGEAGGSELHVLSDPCVVGGEVYVRCACGLYVDWPIERACPLGEALAELWDATRKARIASDRIARRLHSVRLNYRVAVGEQR